MLSIWYPEQQCDLYVHVFVKYIYIMFTEHVECIGLNLFLVLFQWLEYLSAHCETPLVFLHVKLVFWSMHSTSPLSKCLMELAVTYLCWLYLSHLSLLCWGGCCCTHDGFVLFEGFFRSRYLYFSVTVFLQINSICIQIRNMLFASTAYKYLFLKV